MNEKTKIICFDVTSMPPYEIEPFYNHIKGFAFLTEVKHDPKTLKMVYIRAFLDEKDNVEQLTSGFSGVSYTDITGTNLLDS